MRGLLVLASLLCAVGGVVAALAVLAVTREVRAALPVLLDLLLAAGLLRLAAGDSWTAIATAAVVVAVKRVAGTGVRSSEAVLHP